MHRVFCNLWVGSWYFDGFAYGIDDLVSALLGRYGPRRVGGVLRAVWLGERKICVIDGAGSGGLGVDDDWGLGWGGLLLCTECDGLAETGLLCWGYCDVVGGLAWLGVFEGRV